jgi:hypothetical protein
LPSARVDKVTTTSACSTRESHDRDALVRDVMLYQAKGAGRNNVQVALRLIEGGRA